MTDNDRAPQCIIAIAEPAAAMHGFSFARRGAADLRVMRERSLALLATYTGGLVAAEGNAGVELVPGVDPDSAGLEGAQDCVRHVQVLRKYASRQAILCVICTPDHLKKRET